MQKSHDFYTAFSIPTNHHIPSNLHRPLYNLWQIYYTIWGYFIVQFVDFCGPFSGSVDKYWGHRNKKHKKQPFGDASASHLSLVLWHVWFQAEAWICHTTTLTPPSYEVGGIAKRIKTARLRRKTNPVETWYFTSAHNCYTILNISYLSRMQSVESTEKI